MNKDGAEWLSELDYVGGGYFRVRAPKGQASRVIHGPEMLKIARELQSEVLCLRESLAGIFCSKCNENPDGHAGRCASCGQEF